jgi:hypothetical protein
MDVLRGEETDERGDEREEELGVAVALEVMPPEEAEKAKRDDDDVLLGPILEVTEAGGYKRLAEESDEVMELEDSEVAQWIESGGKKTDWKSCSSSVSSRSFWCLEAL